VQGWAFCFPTLAAQKRRVEGGAPGKNKINCTINDKINRKVDDTINRKINDPTSAKKADLGARGCEPGNKKPPRGAASIESFSSLSRPCGCAPHEPCGHG
jgi:hypothetical protein